MVSRTIIIAAIVSLMGARTGHAGRMQSPCPQSGYIGALCCPGSVNLRDATYPGLGTPCTLNLSFVRSTFGTPMEPGIVAGRQSSRTLVPQSFDLCVYGLMGLGVYESLSWTRRRARTAPSFCRNGWFLQSRPCLAVSLRLLWPEPVVHSVRPNDMHDDVVAQRDQEATVALWRKTQFSPTADAPRGPPLRS